MSRVIKFSILFGVIIALVPLAVHAKKSKRPQAISVMAGSNVPSLGLALDASYDATLDGLIPGYKILNIAITNNSIDILNMSKFEDKWLLIDAKGKKHEAITNLRDQNPEVWSGLPERLRGFLEYPQFIQIGETRAIDLLFKDSVILLGFNEVQFTSIVTGRQLNIVGRE